MKIDAIIFDKDGTLIDFDAFWVSVSKAAIDKTLLALNIKKLSSDEILEAFGIHNGKTDINGVLCKGTYEEMGKITFDILKKHKCEVTLADVTDKLIESYNESAKDGKVLPTSAGLAGTLRKFKAQGKKLAVVTTDNRHITEKCLAELGISELFDKIYTDDGINPTKPHPYCADDFALIAGIPKNRILMVGDTLTDMKFANNAGISVVGIAKSEEGRALLYPFADTVISEIDELTNILE